MFVFDYFEAANTASDGDAHPFGVVRSDADARIPDGHVGGRDRELREAGRFSNFFIRQPIARTETLHLTRDSRPVRRSVESRNRTNARAALTGGFPGDVRPDADWGATAAGLAQIKWAAVASAIGMPLIVSPVAAMLLTALVFPLMSQVLPGPTCVCVSDSPPALDLSDAAAVSMSGAAPAFGVSSGHSVRLASADACQSVAPVAVWNSEELIHWGSAAAISFSRAMNDTPKIAALILLTSIMSPAQSFLLIGALMAAGGIVFARKVAVTMSQKVTSIDPIGGMSANLVGALLIGVAARLGMPVSTTHVTMGGIFAVGLFRSDKTNWKMVSQIVLAWLVTLPLGLLSGAAAQRVLMAIR